LQRCNTFRETVTTHLLVLSPSNLLYDEWSLLAMVASPRFACAPKLLAYVKPSTSGCIGLADGSRQDGRRRAWGGHLASERW